MKNTSRYYILIIAVSAALFIPFLGHVHLFDWDEINFAESAREMLQTHNFSIVQINFKPFWEKPPLFIWMQALSMLVFGVNEFAARFPNALCGMVTLITVFTIGRKLYGDRFGLLWCLAYAGSLLPHFYFKSGIIDPWFNLFIFLGIYRCILYTNEVEQTKNSILSATFIGLAILTKGPVALVIFVLCTGTFWIMKRLKSIFRIQDVMLFLLTLGIVGGSWFIWLSVSGHSSVIADFLHYQIRLLTTADAGHDGPFYFHAIVLLIGCFPASVFAIRAMRGSPDTPIRTDFKKWMLILFWVVLIVFSIVQTKILHYSSLCYLPITYLAALTFHKLLYGEMAWKRWMSIMLIGIGTILGAAFVLLQFVDEYKEIIITRNMIHDPFAVENLKANVTWTGYEFLIGAIFLAGIIICTLMASRKKHAFGAVMLFITMLVTTNVSAVFLAPKVEGYSQSAAIEFYEGLAEKDCYVATLGFKSYAFMFYARTTETQDSKFMLDGVITKPAYFICKINDVNRIEHDYPKLQELSRKNGFVFLERRPE